MCPKLSACRGPGQARPFSRLHDEASHSRRLHSRRAPALYARRKLLPADENGCGRSTIRRQKSPQKTSTIRRVPRARHPPENGNQRVEGLLRLLPHHHASTILKDDHFAVLDRIGNPFSSFGRCHLVVVSENDKDPAFYILYRFCSTFPLIASIQIVEEHSPLIAVHQLTRAPTVLDCDATILLGAVFLAVRSCV